MCSGSGADETLEVNEIAAKVSTARAMFNLMLRTA
jgi:hypothetical protein